jgi:hypothetical protein
MSKDKMGISKDEVAQKLALAHRAVDPGITDVYRILAPGREGSELEPIKLLEVNVSSTASGIIPIGMPAHPPSGIPYPSVIMEIAPAEFEEVREGRLSLPNGWLLSADPL